MFQSVQIRNFQSLTDVQLDLAPLTVIVGPSSSGKSAFIRALLVLIRNRRGTEFITHGERTSSISATLATHIVTLTRSTQTSPNAYTLIPTQSRSEKQEFTKLGGDVPAPISLALGIPTALSPLVIASQFDPPYLLSASPTEAARVFGSLTNASVLLDGARESNRRKLQAAQLLRTRATDLAQIQERVPEFRLIATQAQALTRAEALITHARALSTRLTDLTQALDTLTIAQDRIPALRAHLHSLPDPQALSAALDASQARHTAAHTRLTLFRSHITHVNTASLALTGARTLALSTETAVTSASRDLAQTLSGFEKALVTYMREHSKTLDSENKLDLEEASRLATAYVTSLDSADMPESAYVTR